MDDIGAEKAGQLFNKGLAQLNVALPEQAKSNLVQYCLELLKWNRKINLVARHTSLQDVVEKHFLDSLTLVPVLEAYIPAEARLLDVGSGAGFPGLVVKSACPELPVSLLEPRQRRVSFLRHIIRTLALADIEVIPHRSDEKEAKICAEFGIITSRAVADVSTFLAMIDDLSNPGTYAVCMQGASGKEQWEGEKNNPQFSRIEMRHISLPFSRANRFILIFKKNP